MDTAFDLTYYRDTRHKVTVRYFVDMMKEAWKMGVPFLIAFFVIFTYVPFIYFGLRLQAGDTLDPELMGSFGAMFLAFLMIALALHPIKGLISVALYFYTLPDALKLIFAPSEQRISLATLGFVAAFVLWAFMPTLKRSFELVAFETLLPARLVPERYRIERARDRLYRNMSKTLKAFFKYMKQHNPALKRGRVLVFQTRDTMVIEIDQALTFVLSDLQAALGAAVDYEAVSGVEFIRFTIPQDPANYALLFPNDKKIYMVDLFR